MNASRDMNPLTMVYAVVSKEYHSSMNEIMEYDSLKTKTFLYAAFHRHAVFGPDIDLGTVVDMFFDNKFQLKMLPHTLWPRIDPYYDTVTDQSFQRHFDDCMPWGKTHLDIARRDVENEIIRETNWLVNLIWRFQQGMLNTMFSSLVDYLFGTYFEKGIRVLKLATEGRSLQTMFQHLNSDQSHPIPPPEWLIQFSSDFKIPSHNKGLLFNYGTICLLGILFESELPEEVIRIPTMPRSQHLPIPSEYMQRYKRDLIKNIPLDELENIMSRINVFGWTLPAIIELNRSAGIKGGIYGHSPSFTALFDVSSSYDESFMLPRLLKIHPKEIPKEDDATLMRALNALQRSDISPVREFVEIMKRGFEVKNRFFLYLASELLWANCYNVGVEIWFFSQFDVGRTWYIDFEEFEWEPGPDDFQNHIASLGCEFWKDYLLQTWFKLEPPSPSSSTHKRKTGAYAHLQKLSLASAAMKSNVLVEHSKYPHGKPVVFI